MRKQTYQRNLKKLLDYAALCSVKITYRNLSDADGEYVSGTRRITIADNISHAEEIATILHELGHFIDEQVNPKLALSREATSLYTRDTAGVPLTKRESHKIMAHERRAWELGKVLARQLKIALGPWYTKEYRNGMRAYKP